jgi:hypothetical protein
MTDTIPNTTEMSEVEKQKSMLVTLLTELSTDHDFIRHSMGEKAKVMRDELNFALQNINGYSGVEDIDLVELSDEEISAEVAAFYSRELQQLFEEFRWFSKESIEIATEVISQVPAFTGTPNIAKAELILDEILSTTSQFGLLDHKIQPRMIGVIMAALPEDGFKGDIEDTITES